jgi:hypothetical protein
MTEKELPEEKSSAEETAQVPDDAVKIASLLRDKKSGDLLVLMDEQHYAKVSEIDDAEVRNRLEYAAADLTRWLAVPGGSKDKAMETTPLEPDAAVTKPLSMIDGINAILERKAAEGEIKKGLRLFEGPDGAVRVFVGVNSYEVDKIRDKRTSKVIKEAVAEWEAQL